MFKFIVLSSLVVCSMAYDVSKHQQSHRIVAASPNHLAAQEHSSLHTAAAYQPLEYSSVHHPENAHVQYVHAVEQPSHGHGAEEAHIIPEHAHFEQDAHYFSSHEQHKVAHPVHGHHESGGHSDPHDAHAEITASETLFKSNGEYAFGFEATNGISQKESGLGGHSVKGSSQHYTPEGELVTLKYVADEHGFHAEGSHIPTPPPLPQHVIDTLAWNAAHPEEEEEDHLYEHEHDHHHHQHHEHEHDHHHEHYHGDHYNDY